MPARMAGRFAKLVREMRALHQFGLWLCSNRVDLGTDACPRSGRFFARLAALIDSMVGGEEQDDELSSVHLYIARGPGRFIFSLAAWQVHKSLGPEFVTL